MLRIDIRGLPELRKRLEAAGASLAPSAENAITYDIAVTTMDEAQKTVPVRMGQLRASAFIRKPQSGNSPLVTMGYEAPYALYVHEIPYQGGMSDKEFRGMLKSGSKHGTTDRAARALSAVNDRISRTEEQARQVKAARVQRKLAAKKAKATRIRAKAIKKYSGKVAKAAGKVGKVAKKFGKGLKRVGKRLGKSFRGRKK